MLIMQITNSQICDHCIMMTICIWLMKKLFKMSWSFYTVSLDKKGQFTHYDFLLLISFFKEYSMIDF